MFDQHDSQLPQPFAGTRRRVTGYPDLNMLDRLRLGYCASQAGRDPRCSLGPQQPINWQQHDRRSLGGIGNRNIQVDTDTLDWRD